MTMSCGWPKERDHKYEWVKWVFSAQRLSSALERGFRVFWECPSGERSLGNQGEIVSLGWPRNSCIFPRGVGVSGQEQRLLVFADNNVASMTQISGWRWMDGHSDQRGFFYTRLFILLKSSFLLELSVVLVILVNVNTAVFCKKVEY